MALAHQYQYAEKESYTEDEYFEFGRTSFGRWEYVKEYVKGQIRAMIEGFHRRVKHLRVGLAHVALLEDLDERSI